MFGHRSPTCTSYFVITIIFAREQILKHNINQEVHLVFYFLEFQQVKFLELFVKVITVTCPSYMCGHQVLCNYLYCISVREQILKHINQEVY